MGELVSGGDTVPLKGRKLTLGVQWMDNSVCVCLCV